MKKPSVIAGLVVFASLLVLGFFARPAYRHYQERRSLEQANGFFARGDFSNASLSARQALQSNPRNLDACRVMAQLAPRSRSPHLLDWLRRIVDLEPPIEN